MCNNDQVGTSALRAPGAQTATEWAKFGLWALRLAKQGKSLSSEGKFGPSRGPVRAGQTFPLGRLGAYQKMPGRDEAD